MRPIAQKNRKIIDSDPYYRFCARADEGDCQGRITIEHAIIVAGRQLDEMWALLPICAYHHSVNQFQDCGKMNKEKHEWLALNRATDEELEAISKAVDYKRKREYLNSIYGKP